MSKATHAASGANWLTTTDHKRIALQFLWWTCGAFLLGAIYAIILRLRVTSGLVDPGLYRQMLTQHGILMVFLFLVPAIPSVLGNYLLPMQLGVGELRLPWLTRLSLRLQMAGTVLLVLSIMFGAVGAGWTFVTPMSLAAPGAFWLLALALVCVAGGWLATGLNFIVTVHHGRRPGLGFFQMPIFSWSLYLTAYALVVAGTLFAVLVIYLAAARGAAAGPFGANADPLLWQGYFWFAVQPLAIFALLPAAGVITEVIAGIARRPVVGYRTVVGSLIALLGLGFSTWGVHLIGKGQSPALSFVFASLSLLTAVPVALLSFSWLSTLYRGAVACAAPTSFVVAFLLNTGIAVMSGLMLCTLAASNYLANTVFATAHLHYVMMGGVLTALLAGLHYWWPVMFDRMYNPLLGRLSAFTYLVGLNLAFLPQLIAGARGVPQGLANVPAGVGGLDVAATWGMWILTTGLVMIISNLFGALHDGPKSSANPWGATTGEWRGAAGPAVGDPYAR
ncbi:MAG: cbb3-type cytochrome c oxidase subunit I [bacterium]|nr:cbb3-type cytochrome c oxidase subunit I [bacterium]